MPPNPYAAAQQVENQTPIGFGAERANLMGEQTVSMPEQTPATDAGAAGEEAAGSDLSSRAVTAKNQLVQEILAFNNDKDQVEQAEPVPETSKAAQFTVKDPVQVGKVTKYTVDGVDAKGGFSVQRRYNEFEALHKALLDRWPGVYVPNIPEKTAISVDVSSISYQSSKDADFVENRRLLLEKFVKGIAQFDYLVESMEF